MDNKSLEFCLNKFKKLKVSTIGRSEDNRNIYSLSAFFAASRPWVIIQASIHAREHLSTDLCIMFAQMIESNYEYYKSNYPNICFIPMCNPDGVEITFKGKKAINDSKLKKQVESFLHNNDFRMYKSNARGVDLNNNFDAKWNNHIGSKGPGFQGYKGESAFSERESLVLASITLCLKPIFTISLHTKGEEIYYDFYQTEEIKSRDKKIAEMISNINGYKIKSTERVSFGGYKDWCIQMLKIPALTIELGRDEYIHPVKSQEIYEIIAKNSGIIDNLCDIVKLCKET